MLFVYVVVRTRNGLSCLAVPPERVDERPYAAPAHERHDYVDRICRWHLGAKLVADRGLARRVREHGRVEQRRQRPSDSLGAAVGERLEQGDQDATGVDGLVAVEIGRSAGDLPKPADERRSQAHRFAAPRALRRSFDRSREEAREVARHAIGGLCVAELGDLGKKRLVGQIAQ